MGSIGPVEILVVLVVALLVLGPQKLPEAARSVGRAIGEVRRYTAGFQSEMRDAFAGPTPSTRPPPATAGETTIATADTVDTVDTVDTAETADPTGQSAAVPLTDNGDTPSA